MASRFTVVGIGEALFDVFPDAAALGGAPLNMVVHAHALAQRRGGRAVLVSRVGQDARGEELLGGLRERGLDVSYIQSDPDRPTGEVFVTVDDAGQPTYEIAPNAAWDNLQFDPDLEDLARHTDAVCFGTLAQRDAQSRNAVLRFLDAARRAVRLFDVNLRQTFFDAPMIRRSLEFATIAKLNEHELPRVCEMLALPPEPQQLLKRYDLKMVALTRGARGTVLYTPAGVTEGEPVPADAVEGADSVGAGDACAAGLLVGLSLRKPLRDVVTLANRCGAFVAGQAGATPKLPDRILDLV